MNKVEPSEIMLSFDDLRFDPRIHDMIYTGRRFNRVGGEYVEIPKDRGAIYDCAQFGEVVLETRGTGVNRTQRAQIIYGRIAHPTFQEVALRAKH